MEEKLCLDNNVLEVTPGLRVLALLVDRNGCPTEYVHQDCRCACFNLDGKESNVTHTNREEHN